MIEEDGCILFFAACEEVGDDGFSGEVAVVVGWVVYLVWLFLM